MLPLQQAYEAKASVLEYLKATFGFRDRELREAFNHFIENPQEGLFKGPYISLNLPFEKAKENSSSQHLDILPSFSPFIHQVESFKRLSNKNNNNPLPTLLTTGTGSGKTEAFLYPLLDYCYQNRRRKGIKAIILYPMNALATDQAQRIAETIYNDPRLKDDVTAGLLIGTGTQKHHYPTFMGDKHVIENRQTIIDYPPDILLTNFKMLDYALMRHNFHNLWNYNLQDNTLLKYLVLDELHTYDGAQGTDVANLIRRLKLKLKIPDKQICPVGTSATLGTGKDSKNLLANYASDVFGEKITEDAVIEEKRVNVDEFFNIEGSEDFLPRGAAIKKAKIGINENYNNYIQKQKKLWQISEEVDDIELSEELKSFRLIKDISDVTSNRIYHINELTNKIAERNKKFSAYKKDEQLSLIESALALLSQAKSKSGDKVSPLINMQVQYWMRELSGILRKVSEKPEFTFRAEQTNEENAALPAWFCRECGASGWVAAMNERDEEIETDIQKVYNYYFSNHKNVYLINTDKEENRNIEEYNPTDTLKETPYLNVENLKLNNRSNDKSIPIIGYHKVSNNRNIYDCPNCNTSNTINIIGTRIATLASVTTSQVLSSDLDPTKDANRKILSFTNGVQDAAHKSGFIQSRNYRFTFRTALQNVINQQDRPVNIQELHDAFTKYWKENASEEKNSKLEAYYSKFFPSDHLDVQISFDQDFEEEFDRRILWQITSEFGYNAIIGRTLEKTGSSGTYFVNDKIEQVYEKMQEWLDENTLGHISKEDFSKFLVAFLHRLRRRGGIDHPYLLNFRTQSSSYFQITQKTNPHYFLIKNFGKSTRLPKLLSDTNLNVYDSTTRKKALIWSHEYFIKNFPLAQNQIELINDFYKELLNKLAEVNVLDEKETSKARNFALNPVEVYVGKEPVIYECKKCGHRLTTTREANGILQSAKCINYRCKGEYEEIKMGDDFNYYRQVYNRQRTPRIYAADHTGLLERRKREEIESSFKKRQSFRDYNVLVATSTLEMGIDIGDLNIAMNMDVPPQPANYLQRIGRAGRKSGNAFIMNFSGNEAHDLFYYEEPSEMMEGDIHTPGCYLEAIDILRRHFFAFCLDSWTAYDPSKNRIPHTINSLRLPYLNLQDNEFFGNQIVAFIKTNKKDLFDAFKSQYKEEVDKEIFNELEQEFINHDSFYKRFLKEFKYLQEENKSFNDRKEEIHNYVKNKKLADSDPEYLELQNVIRALNFSQKALKRRLLLEHLTNKGFLPNYAFPETGVQLNAIVNRKTRLDKDNPKSIAKSNVAIELVRSARSAIKELIPENYFYTQGYKLQITGINITDPKQEIKRFRFCSSCDCIMDIADAPTGNCPKCGDPSWQSESNVHEFVRLTSVKSYSYEKEARIDDTEDTRKDLHPIISRHFNFNIQSSKGAHVSDEIPFGIEFFDNVVLTEANIGMRDSFISHSRSVQIKGQEIGRAGYITCRVCGKSTTTTYKKGKEKKADDFHFPYCNKKDVPYKGISDETFRELYLFRTLNTEAIKILLPTHDFQTESQIAMFKAGINLGLKEYYSGNPEHIEITEYSEFNKRTNRQEHFLILYDTIPGGTGYLSKLFDEPKEFTKVIELAHERIENCTCQQRGKDGCYRCIFTYSNQYERENLSRTEAERIFSRIHQNIKQWSFQKEGLTEINDFGKLEESELEDRFISVIKSYAESNEHNFQILKDPQTYYKLQIKKDKEPIEYEIRPQIDLGLNDNIPIYTCPDFIIYCNNSNVKIKPIAVYLDGYKYHASEENNHFQNDIIKRNNIIESGEYFVWTLTWNDLKKYQENEKDQLELAFNDHKHFHKFSKYPNFSEYESTIEKAPNSVYKLLWLMEHPNKDYKTVSQFLLTYAQSKLGGYLLNSANQERFCKDSQATIDEFPYDREKSSSYYLDLLNFDNNFKVKLFSHIQNLSISGCLQIRELKGSNNGYYEKEGWEYFWQLYNLLQFNNEDIIIQFNDEIIDTQEEPEGSVENILENFEEHYHDLIRSLLAKGIDFNKEDYFVLQDEQHTIIAEAMLGLTEEKMVVEPLDEQSREVFEQNGYKISTAEKIKSTFNL